MTDVFMTYIHTGGTRSNPHAWGHVAQPPPHQSLFSALLQGRLGASSPEPEWVGDLVGKVVGDVVGVSVGMSELNSDSLVGTKVGNKVAASITSSQHAH